MDKKERKIAVFDSGVGGISVLKELMAIMPEEHYLYFGDSINAPYGTRTTEEVRVLSLNAAAMLYERGIKALVVACNTATAAAITQIRAEYPNLIVVGIEPALKMATDRFPRGHVGIMATQVTLREEKLEHLVCRFPDATVEKIPAPGLVELVEQGKADSEETEQLLRQILAPYLGQLDAIVLGCTHYPFVRDTVQKVLGECVQVLDGGAGTARQTKRLLEEQGLLRKGKGSLKMENSSGKQELLDLGMELLKK
ncbi:MAG: glutamate racemase [Oscillospiraceae bacterium]|nr:glutamate racemase [Oscillospiraceae bacterium]